MNEKSSVFVICVEVIIYLLLYNLHDCTFNDFIPKITYNTRSEKQSKTKQTKTKIKQVNKKHNKKATKQKQKRNS